MLIQLSFSEIKDKVIDAIERRDFDTLEKLTSHFFADPHPDYNSLYKPPTLKEIICMGFDMHVMFYNIERLEEERDGIV